VEGGPAGDFLPDFSQFESTRDLSDSAKAGQTTPTLPGSTTSTAAPAPTPASTVPVTPPVASVTPPTSIPSGVDKDGKPLTVDIKLEDSPLFRSPGQPAPVPAATTPSTQPTTPSVSHVPELENGRDMQGFTPEERKMFRDMSNDSFRYLAPIYRESKQLKQQVETTRQEAKLLQDQLQQQKSAATDPVAAINPLGYALTPEYAQIVQQTNNYSTEASHWQKQLGELLAGRKPKQLIRDDRGQYFEGQELPADANTQAWIQNNLIKANQYSTQVQQVEAQFRQNYQVRIVSDIQAIRQAEDHYFPWFKEGNPTAQAFKPVIDGIVQQLPPSQRNNVFAPWLGKSYALIQHLQRRVAELEGRPQQAAATQIQSPLATTGSIPATTTTNGEVTMDAFEQAKQQ
jgi:hypothetical protein